jgi:hypothetical protein
MVKRMLFVAAVVTLVAAVTPVWAQSVEGGFKIGYNAATLPNLSTALGDSTLTGGRRNGAALGGFVAFPLNENVAIQPEVLFVQQGVNLSNTTDEYVAKLDYLQIPVLARFSSPSQSWGRGFFFAGPTFGMRLSAKVSSGALATAVEQDAKDLTRAGDVGLAFGGGVDVRRFLAELRFTQGLTHVNSDAANLTENVRNRAFTIMAGIRF